MSKVFCICCIADHVFVYSWDIVGTLLMHKHSQSVVNKNNQNYNKWESSKKLETYFVFCSLGNTDSPCYCLFPRSITLNTRSNHWNYNRIGDDYPTLAIADFSPWWAFLSASISMQYYYKYDELSNLTWYGK